MNQCFDRSELSDKKRPETVWRLWDPRGRGCACKCLGAGLVHVSPCARACVWEAACGCSCAYYFVRLCVHLCLCGTYVRSSPQQTFVADIGRHLGYRNV